MTCKVPRLLLTAFHSGGGKTTVTCALLRALGDVAIRPSAFKCGPDYIDPMFHKEVIDVKSRNLDMFLLNEDICRYLLVKNSRGSGVAILEGVMGYYDGLGANSSIASSYHLAQATETPVILIADCKGVSFSLAALIKGFAEFRSDSNIQGVILNRLSSVLYPMYKKMIEEETGIQVVGYFPYAEEYTLASRHLGLVTATEVKNIQHKIELMGQMAQETIDLHALLEIAQRAKDLTIKEDLIKEQIRNALVQVELEEKESVTIAVAKDKAFCFYYQDSIELLEEMGARVQYFSPLLDKQCPACDGVILGGGYPELYAEALAANSQMKASLKSALAQGMPCIAECGGFMYLLDQIADKAGNWHQMVGVIQGQAWLTNKLNRFGYIQLTSETDNLLARKGDQIAAHEFHYSEANVSGESFTARKPTTDRQWSCIHATKNLYAGYPHIHLWGNLHFAARFVAQCRSYRYQKSEF